MKTSEQQFPSFDLTGKVALITGEIMLIDGGWTTK